MRCVVNFANDFTISGRFEISFPFFFLFRLTITKNECLKFGIIVAMLHGVRHAKIWRPLGKNWANGRMTLALKRHKLMSPHHRHWVGDFWWQLYQPSSSKFNQNSINHISISSYLNSFKRTTKKLSFCFDCFVIFKKKNLALWMVNSVNIVVHVMRTR